MTMTMTTKSTPTTKAKQAQTQAQAQPKAQKRPYSYSAQFAQLNRQTNLTNCATAHCKQHYPDFFYHKQKLANEAETLRAHLQNGKALFVNLMKINVYALTLTAEQRQALADFNNATAYLCHQLRQIADTVKTVEEMASDSAELAELATHWQNKVRPYLHLNTQSQAQSQEQGQAETEQEQKQKQAQAGEE